MEMSQGLSFDTTRAPWIIDNRKMSKLHSQNPWKSQPNTNSIHLVFLLLHNLWKIQLTHGSYRQYHQNIFQHFERRWTKWLIIWYDWIDWHEWQTLAILFFLPVRSSKVVPFSLAFRWLSRDISLRWFRTVQMSNGCLSNGQTERGGLTSRWWFAHLMCRSVFGTAFEVSRLFVSNKAVNPIQLTVHILAAT